MWNVRAARQDNDLFLKAHDAMVSGVLYDVGNIAVAEVVAHPAFTPHTGALQQATKFRLVRTSGGRVVRISNAKSYSSFVEEGTRPHKIVARNGRALRFYVKGSVVFRRSVNHPGTKPYWFLRSAVDVAGARAQSMLLSGMRRISRSNIGR